MKWGRGSREGLHGPPHHVLGAWGRGQDPAAEVGGGRKSEDRAGARGAGPIPGRLMGALAPQASWRVMIIKIGQSQERLREHEWAIHRQRKFK